MTSGQHETTSPCQADSVVFQAFQEMSKAESGGKNHARSLVLSEPAQLLMTSCDVKTGSGGQMDQMCGQVRRQVVHHMGQRTLRAVCDWRDKAEPGFGCAIPFQHGSDKGRRHSGVVEFQVQDLPLPLTSTSCGSAG